MTPPSRPMTATRTTGSPIAVRGAVALAAAVLAGFPHRADGAEPGSLGINTGMTATQLVVITVLALCVLAMIAALWRRERRDLDVLILDVDRQFVDPRTPVVAVPGARGPIGGARMPTPGRVFAEPEPGGYSAAECAEFAAGLGDAVARRALTLFQVLRDEGRVSARRLARELDIPARAVSGSVSGRLSRRAAELGLPLPYDASRPGRTTLWHDRDGIARRMVAALEQELALRPETRATLVA